MSPSALELVGVSKRFGEVVALADASFFLRPGTIHALLGENGAGKTSLMRVAFGMLAADTGSIRINGEAVRFHAPSDAIAHGVGVVQQHFSLVPAFTSVENFALGGRGTFDRANAAQRLERYAAELGLSVTADARPSMLSAAEQQQLEIAKALGRECRILILDEPGRCFRRLKPLRCWSGFVHTHSGLEGSVKAGAFGAALVTQTLGADAGLLGGVLAGSLIGAFFALFVVSLRINQVIAGTAIMLLAFGLTGTLACTLFGGQGIAPSLPTLAQTEIPGLWSVPIIGRVIFAQPYVVYLALAGTILMHWWLSRTHAGLGLRAVGESPFAAIAAGINPLRVRWLAILVGCALAGLSGAVLVLAQAGTFVEGMSAGRCYIAIAIVALGRWQPLRVLVGSCLFGASMALQFAAQTLDWRVPYQLLLATPYLVTLVVLVASARGSVPPAALGSLHDDT